jgi:dCTP deaminase
MILSDVELKAALHDELVIEPYDHRLMRPASYLLRLGDELLVSQPVDGGVTDVKRPETLRSGFIRRPIESTALLHNGELALAASQERLSIPADLVGIIGGLSHLARAGLAVHVTSPFVSPGFGASGPSPLTLELTMLHPSSFRLYRGMPICHLFLARLGTPSSAPYDEAIRVLSGMDGPSLGRYDEEFLDYLDEG